MSQVKKVEEELNCFYSDVLNLKVLMMGLLCVFNNLQLVGSTAKRMLVLWFEKWSQAT